MNPIGRTIKSLLQTTPEYRGVVLEEFGESYWMDLVAELDDGSLISIGEYEIREFKGDRETLIPTVLTHKNYSLKSIEGKEIVGLTDSDGEFAIHLNNGVFLICEGAPGGNYAAIWEGDYGSETS